MTKSDDAFLNKGEEIWEFIKEHPRYMGIPISDKRGLDILNALRDIWLANKTNPNQASNMLTMLAAVLVSASSGQGEQMVQEVLIHEAMIDFDEQAKGLLNEGH